MADTGSKAVLVCLGERKREVCFRANSTEEEEWKAFMDAVRCTFADVLPGSSSGSSGNLIVQLKNENWEGEFVDFPKNSKITHHSVLRIIPQSESLKGKGLAEKGSYLCKKMGNPSLTQKERLGQLFRGGSKIGGGSGSRKRSFDPQSESVVLSNQRKKRAAIRSVRPVTREVMLLSEYTPKIPKGRFRTELKDNGRMKSLQFTRTMTPKEASDVIMKGFHTLEGFSKFQYLDTNKDVLDLSSNQVLAGNDVIDRRGALYLCEKWNEGVIDATTERMEVTSTLPPSLSAGDSTPSVSASAGVSPLTTPPSVSPLTTPPSVSPLTTPPSVSASPGVSPLTTPPSVSAPAPLTTPPSVSAPPGVSPLTTPSSVSAPPGVSLLTTPPSVSAPPGVSPLTTPPSVSAPPGVSRLTTPPSVFAPPGVSPLTTPPSVSAPPGVSLLTTVSASPGVSLLTIPSSVSEDINQRRELIREQNWEYEESLRADEEKDARRLMDRERVDRLASLREQLAERLVARYCMEGHGKQLMLRLPDGKTLSVRFLQGTQIQVLYQYVFVKGGIDVPFGIFNLFPRTLLDHNSDTLVEDIRDAVLAVETSGDNSNSVLFNPTDFIEEGMTEISEVEKVLKKAKTDREAYLESITTCRWRITRTVIRSDIFDSVLSLYSGEHINALLLENPLTIQFEGEQAIDLGGVCREMYSAFFEEMYRRAFDGNILLSPVVHPQIDFGVLPKIGTVISHCYVACGVLPIRIAFPALVQCLLGLSAVVSDFILCETFIDSLSTYEADSFKQAFAQITDDPQRKSFSEELSSKLIATFSRFGSRTYPTPTKLKQMLLQVASYEFLLKPAAAITAINRGIPPLHAPFWQKLGVAGILAVYRAQTVSPAKVLGMLDEEQGKTENEERVLGYLRQFVASLSEEDLRLFLRFCTGSTVCNGGKLGVSFNALEGVGRRPIAHTCEPCLELSSNYYTFPEFVTEFKAYLANEYSWIMDAL